ncbi:aromatic ring-hydroxylating dioxygenase subunit alpha [Cupriavidus metallidurans]|uniref:aromatic ring-hydroxylating dioxygenase subunit alpha n=1 Tax=Cupriavidus metallidurans TaxID=119219 RepID=UPI001CCB5383|nr:aromatic ring-hydroxylating dioxygenase subunit alpha [Cupriavidus metallidurans]UBM09379.1 aromatic ring-hydroxylating dioxygenase subunit alpha [Cupriavidus metallidurans]
MFPKNTWYVAAWADEISTAPVARTFLSQPVVLYRGHSGRVAALEDRCCHRALPLHHGDVVGDCLRCAYHGLEYNAEGQCVRIPGQDKIPVKAKVRRFPVVEKDDLIWIWMGDEELAKADDVPSYPWHGDKGWKYRKNTYLIQANHLLIYDNLLDLTHLGYVHKRTIGGDAETHFAAKTTTTRTDKGVRVERWMLDSVPPPTYTAAYTFGTERVDRWQEIEFEPGLVRIFTGAKDVGKGAPQGDRDNAYGFRGLNAMTPETEDTTHYFWSAAHNFRIDEPAVTDAIYDNIVITFNEDKEIIESQYLSMQRDPDRGMVDISFDVAPVQARRYWDALNKAEAPSALTVEAAAKAA